MLPFRSCDILMRCTSTSSSQAVDRSCTGRANAWGTPPDPSQSLAGCVACSRPGLFRGTTHVPPPPQYGFFHSQAPCPYQAPLPMALGPGAPENGHSLAPAPSSARGGEGCYSTTTHPRHLPPWGGKGCKLPYPLPAHNTPLGWCALP